MSMTSDKQYENLFNKHFNDLVKQGFPDEYAYDKAIENAEKEIEEND
jgi:hypothetical protein|tara:strand:+ start:277 stop:417 length:141 start_codon:yes stop_codon:yes gene_type:complete